MLGRTARESSAHAALAAHDAGWSGVAAGSPVPSAVSDETEELLDLGTTSQALETVASIDDLAAVVHLGHPEQPAPMLEQALLAGAPTLLVTAAVPVRPQWVWVAPPGVVGGQVVVDEAGMRDCADTLRSVGVSPRLVPTATPVEERAALAGDHGSLVVERSRVPAGWVEVPGGERLAEQGPVWYGLLESADAWPRFGGSAQVWLAFGPSDDHRGSLRETLGVLADAGVDLQHLRSHPSAFGPHVFLTSFRCPRVTVLDALVAELDARSVAHRTLAVLPGERFEPGPDALTPRWAGA
ncbi:hypothetical protein BCE75_10468 [Isoptericola sp. CG 20/1183]|uniref:Uncharacterized protein n=1 Tax=Isoptericola halotolerans TaxID=300560 RepID=A0ABX5EJ01_9MICO|nr:MULTISPECIES: hypothetical protein [Isoptericola]PRZ07754.1 hypothetical protein BCL65_104197 [Isoptericola halotolerans]PRZ07887.1 hypothetical protein BCE75_10468 [Isoptericola sp. CG 20/1183]